MDYVTHDELEVFRQEVRNHKSRAHRKMLLLYLALIGGIVLFLAVQARSEHQADQREKDFRHAIVQVCEKQKANTENLNALIDTFIVRVQQADELTPKEQEEFVDLYSSAKGDVPQCPPA